MTRAEEFSKRQKGNNIMGLPELGGHPRDSTLVGRLGTIYCSCGTWHPLRCVSHGLFRGAVMEFRPAEQKYKSGEKIVKWACESHCEVARNLT